MRFLPGRLHRPGPRVVVTITVVEDLAHGVVLIAVPVGVAAEAVVPVGHVRILRRGATEYLNDRR